MSDLFDQAKNLASQHPDQANQALDAAEQMAKERTGGQYDAQIDQARDAAGQQFGVPAGEPAPADPATQQAAPADPSAAENPEAPAQ